MWYIAYMYILLSYQVIWFLVMWCPLGNNSYSVQLILTVTKAVSGLQQFCLWEGLCFKRWMINFSTVGCIKFFFLAALLLATQCGYSVCNSPGTKSCEKVQRLLSSSGNSRTPFLCMLVINLMIVHLYIAHGPCWRQITTAGTVNAVNWADKDSRRRFSVAEELSTFR